MYHLDNVSGVPEMPEPKDTQSISPRWFGESQEQGGISWPGADWFNIIQAELLSVLKESGLSPDKLSYNQLSQSIKSQAKKAANDAVKWFSIDDFGAVPDMDVASKTVITDSAEAIKLAQQAAEKVNGRIYVPRCPKGKAYYSSKGFTLREAPQDPSEIAHGWAGVSLYGDGKYSSRIYFDTDDWWVDISGSSGWPSNIALDKISLYPYTDFKGKALRINGVCVIPVGEVAVYRAGIGLQFSNAQKPGIFTEFSTCRDLWIEDCTINIDFSRDGGDASFHGVRLDGVTSNSRPGQTAIHIGPGCNVYNSVWYGHFFADTPDASKGEQPVLWIHNEGSRNGFDLLFFEGPGAVKNEGGWVTKGMWRVENSTGLIIDYSTTPFCVDNYMTPVQPEHSAFQSLGNIKFSALNTPTHPEPWRGLIRYRAQNTEGIGFIGTEVGNFDYQGFLMMSLPYGQTMSKANPRWLHHYNGLSHWRPEYRLEYMGQAPQLVIRSSGFSSGRKGKRTTGTIKGNPSPQTITTSGFHFPESGTPAHVMIKLFTVTQDVYYSALWVGASNPVGESSMKLIHETVDVDLNGDLTQPASIKVNTSGDIVFTLTAKKDMTYVIGIDGVNVF
ncbi:hypothetical protein [Klebsiella grimontii]|uniref:hypothetical protein n=1 Tax=Klebsiella grimontii TaxID=2058152 RepID=UPI001CCBD942|nr:hypothetical protein [Klebsiella grimontii]